jgi:hypothetical protein
MTILVPLAMFGWIFVTIALFNRRTATEAVTIAVIGGFLLLPAISYNLPGIPSYTKTTSMALGVILGGLFSGASRKYPFRLNLLDVPVLVLCFVSPLATSLLNGLGAYNGFSDLAQACLNWGVFYWAGRKYFSDPASARILARGIALGGLAYVPAVLFEVRMSPQLSNIFYGFFPHSFAQHFRYGGFRPIVFMSHGLMVALWMAVSATVLFWFWRSRQYRNVGVVPISLASIGLTGAAILCKSGNGWVFTALGLASYIYYARSGSTAAFRLLCLMIPVYMVVRITNLIPIELVQDLASSVFDPERIDSLNWRLLQEDLFGAHSLRRPWFGWGGFGRNWPVDPLTGEHLIQMVDSLWIILFSGSGFVGLGSSYLALGLGPWKVLGFYGRLSKEHRKEADGSNDPYAMYAVLLCLVVCFFMLDSLLNAMVSPVYILCSGALTTHYLVRKNPELATVPDLPSSTGMLAGTGACLG